MKIATLESFRRQAFKTRELILESATEGGCFLGSAFSCVDVILYLYSKFLRVSPEKVADPFRDYFFLSKGHAVAALYGVLSVTGFFKEDVLRGPESDPRVYWHPNPNLPGVEHQSGSLGQLLSVAVGVALDIQRTRADNRVVVLLGDGELDEGSIWESLLIASACKLTNLLIIVDRNGMQANFETESLIPLEPLLDKFAAFGCAVKQLDGHDFQQIENSLKSFPLSSSGPSVFVAKTIRGKGIPSIENNWEQWFVQLPVSRKKELLQELRQSYFTTQKQVDELSRYNS